MPSSIQTRGSRLRRGPIRPPMTAFLRVRLPRWRPDRFRSLSMLERRKTATFQSPIYLEPLQSPDRQMIYRGLPR